MSETLLEKKDGVGFITLNRPEKMNAINRALALGLLDKLDECASDASVRAVYITGAGKAFSAGQDLVEAVGGGAGVKKILSEQYNPLVAKIVNLPKPVVAAVNGIAAGASANLALCCDIVVASDAAVFVQSFSKIGLIPDCGGTFILPRLVGWQKASALMLLGEQVSATDAEKMGMIYKVFEASRFAEASVQIAMALSKMPTTALGLTKQALRRSMNNNLNEQLETEMELQTVSASSNDFREGVTAFIEKRSPVFMGN